MFFSNYEEIVLKQVLQGELQFQQDPSCPEEYFLGSEDYFRYKPKRNYSAAPPCDTIFLMNLTEGLLTPENLLPHFSKIGEVKSHKYQYYQSFPGLFPIRTRSTRHF
jgi:hypothetical protein